MPTTAITAVPTADQMAYVVPTDRCFRTSASSQNETPYPSTTIALGKSWVNPSECLRASVAVTSEPIAAASRRASMRSTVPSGRYTSSAFADRSLDELDDLLGRRTGREHLGDPELLELRDVLVGDRPAHGDHHVPGVLLAQELDDPRHQRHVRAGQDRQPDGVGVLLQDGLHDLLGRLVQARVDDLHAGIPERAGDDLRAAVMTVEPGFGHDHANLASHGQTLAFLPRARRCSRAPRRRAPPGSR